MRDIFGVGDEREWGGGTLGKEDISIFFGKYMYFAYLLFCFFGVQSPPTVHPAYNHSGYNDVFFFMNRSHGIDYSCTLSKPL